MSKETTTSLGGNIIVWNVSTFRRSFKRNKYLLLMALPMVAYYVIFRCLPIFGLVISFQNFVPKAGQSVIESIMKSPFVGLKHFRDFFNSLYGKQILTNTLLISVYKILWGFPAPIILALLLNEMKAERLKKVVQSISYLPHFISWVILAGILRFILSPDYGIVVPLFRAMNMAPINFLGDPSYFRVTLVFSDIWQSIGWGSIVYLAAITGLDAQLYEAAAIDGAGKFKQLLHITIPGIMPTVVVMFILRTGSILNAGFDQVFNLYNPAVYSVGDIIDTYVYRVGLEQFQFSYTSAVGFFKSLIGFGMVMLTNYIAHLLGEEGIW